MRKMLTAILFLMAAAVSAGELPWKNSIYWSEDSAPALKVGKMRRMMADKEKFIVAGQDAIEVYTFSGGKYTRCAALAVSGLADAIEINGSILYIDSKNLAMWDWRKNRVTRRNSKLNVQRKAETLPMLAAASKSGKALLAMPKSLYEIDPATLKPVRTRMYCRPKSGAVASLPDGTAIFGNTQGFWHYDGKFTRLPLDKKFSSQDISTIGVSPDSRYFYFGSPLKAYDLQTRQVIAPADMPQAVRWGFTTDTARNHLYTVSWKCVSVIGNASAPDKWQDTGRVTAQNEVPLYGHRDAAPESGAITAVCYLPASDELLVASEFGITVLGREVGKNSFGIVNDYQKYLCDNRKLPGKSRFHDALRQRKYLGAWVVSNCLLDDDAVKNLKRSGINGIIYQAYSLEHGKFWPPLDVRKKIVEIGKLCAAYDMTFTVNFLPYLTSHNCFDPNFRRIIIQDGSVGRLKKPSRNPKQKVMDYPCYLDADHARRAGVHYHIVETAKLVQEAGIASIMFELGDGFTRTNIKDSYCYCDSCFSSFLKSVGKSVPVVAPGKRYSYLGKNKLHSKFAVWQQNELAKIIAGAVAEARRIAPDMGFTLMLPETSGDYTRRWRINAFIQGFQIAGTPVPVFSEQTYGSPFVPELCNKLVDEWQKKGLDVLVIPGQSNVWIRPAQLASRVQEYLQYSPGVYFYRNRDWNSKFRKTPHCFPRHPKFQKWNHTRGEYIDLPLLKK